MTILVQPRRMLIGAGCFERLGVEVAALAANRRRALIVTGRRAMREAGVTDRAQGLLGEAGISSAVFDEVEHDPSLETCERGIEAALAEGCDVAVAIGGGSALDVGKTVAIMVTQAASLRDCFAGVAMIRVPGIPFVAVPTTAGTGAEATRNAVLTDRGAAVKKSLRHDLMVPDVALCDARLTLSAPRSITANAGMDALTQAIECAISRAAQPVSDALSFAAAERLHAALPRVLDDAEDPVAREEMMLGSTMAGLAFGNASLGAVHGLAHALGAELHLPHGFLCGVLLPEVTALNLEADFRDASGRTTREKFEALSARLGYEEPEAMVAGLRRLRALAGLPETLAGCGLTEEHFPAILAKCRSGSMRNNPRDLSDDDVVALLRRLAAPPAPDARAEL